MSHWRYFLVALLASVSLFSVSPLAGFSQEPATLRIAGIDYDYTPAVIEAFQAAHPEIAVEFAEGLLSFEEGQIQTTLQSGSGPDVINVNSGPGRVGALAEAGLILPLDDLYARAGLEETYQPAVIEQLLEQGDGSFFEIVEGLDVFQVYYRTDVFAENGLEVPETWDEFLAVCQTLQDAGIQPLTLGARNNFQGGWLFGTLVQASAGLEAMTEVVYGDGNFTDPNFVRAAEMLTQLVDAGYINGLEAAALDDEQANAAFGQGQAAMMVHAQGFPISLANDGVDASTIAAFPMPSPNDGQAAIPTAGLAHSWVVSASTQNQAAAETWLEFVASDEYLRIAIENGGGLVPARIVPDDIEVAPSVADASAKLEDGVGFNPSVYFSAEGRDAWYAAMQQLLTGQVTPAEAMANVQAALEASRSAE